jgi:hypothetical protein
MNPFFRSLFSRAANATASAWASAPAEGSSGILPEDAAFFEAYNPFVPWEGIQ